VGRSRLQNLQGHEIVRIPCVLAPTTDSLDLFRRDGGGGGGGLLVISARQEENELRNTFLDAEGARALFNWLGVELHKGGLK
jgi:hypothetical protein